MREKLHTCPGCGTPNFTERGLKAHRCKGGAARPEESTLARISRERKAARAAAGKAPAVMPRTKLKRRPAKVVKEAPLLIQIADLSFHPLLARVSMLPDLIERETKLGNAQGKSRGAHKAAAEEMRHDFEALVESVSHYGIRERLKVLKTAKGWQIVDGRHRFEAGSKVAQMRYADPKRDAIARRLQNEGIPCEEVSEADVVPIIMDAVTRRHMSKGARAYLAVLMEPTVATEEKRGGDRSKTAANAVLLTASELAKRAGVSPRLVEDAIALFRLFEKRKDVRKKFEDAIWVGAGLAKLRAGIEGYLATGADPTEELESEEQAEKRIALKRYEEAATRWVEMKTSLKHWEKITPENREELITHAAKCIQETPEEFRAGLMTRLAEA